MILLIALGLAFFVVEEAWRIPVIIGGAAIELGETIAEVWWSRRAKIKVGPETLIGASAEVIEACRPDGRVRIRGESWAAHCEAGADVGQSVRVISRDRLTLVVEPQN